MCTTNTELKEAQQLKLNETVAFIGTMSASELMECQLVVNALATNTDRQQDLLLQAEKIVFAVNPELGVTVAELMMQSSEESLQQDAYCILVQLLFLPKVAASAEVLLFGLLSDVSGAWKETFVDYLETDLLDERLSFQQYLRLGAKYLELSKKISPAFIASAPARIPVVEATCDEWRGI